MQAAVLLGLFLCIVKINSVQMLRLADLASSVLFMFPLSFGNC